MTPRTFFRVSLLLPLLVPVAAWVWGSNFFTSLLVLSIVVAGVPYLLFAIGMWIALGRARSILAVPRPILFAPLLFLPVELLAWLGWSGYTSGFGWGLIGAAFAFLPFAFYILALGYVYVAFTILLFNVCTHFGCIR